MAQRDVDLRDALGVSRGLRLAMQSNSRNARSIRQDLDVLHGSSGALRRNTERFEDGLLTDPASSEGRCGERLATAVGYLRVGEVALDKGRVPRRDSGNELCCGI